jgi:hypothetical protein
MKPSQQESLSELQRVSNEFSRKQQCAKNSNSQKNLSFVSKLEMLGTLLSEQTKEKKQTKSHNKPKNKN